MGLVPTIESLNTCGRKISRSLRRRGLLGTAREAMKRGLVYLKLALSPARRAARRCWEARAEAEFDHAHGVDTAGSVSLDTLDEVVGPHRNEGAWYSGVDFVLLREQIATLGIDFPQYTFIDLGCGKGRVLLIAAQFPFRQVRGVEFAPALHAVAEKNIAVYRGPRRCCDVRADLADAAEYPVPTGRWSSSYSTRSVGRVIGTACWPTSPGRTRSSPGTSGSSTGTRRRRPCSTGTDSPASPMHRKVRRSSIGVAIGASYGGSSPAAAATPRTFSPWPLILVDRADSLLLNVGE